MFTQQYLWYFIPDISRIKHQGHEVTSSYSIVQEFGARIFWSWALKISASRSSSGSGSGSENLIKSQAQTSVNLQGSLRSSRNSTVTWTYRNPTSFLRIFDILETLRPTYYVRCYFVYLLFECVARVADDSIRGIKIWDVGRILKDFKFWELSEYGNVRFQ